MTEDIEKRAAYAQTAINRAVAAVSSLAMLSHKHIAVLSSTALPEAEMIRDNMLRALKQTNGDVEAAAALIGIGRTTFYRRLHHDEALLAAARVDGLCKL